MPRSLTLTRSKEAATSGVTMLRFARGRLGGTGKIPRVGLPSALVLEEIEDESSNWTRIAHSRSSRQDGIRNMINKGNGGKSFNKLKEEFLLNQNALQKHANTLKEYCQALDKS